MSTPVCVYTRNRRLVLQGEVEALLQELSQQGPDGRGLWCKESIGLGHLALYETPEMRHERQPAPLDARISPNAPHDIVISADVRLDNRAELAGKLQIPAELLSALGDSQLLLAAYLRWGESCIRHLLGDFAFVIWDGPQQKLFCGRDPLGVKPLYTYIQPDLCLIAGDLRALVAHPHGPHHANQQALAYFLSESQFIHPTMTYVQGVVALLPAHTLTVTSDRAQLRRYWFPDQLPTLHFPSLDSAAEALRDLLEDAVRVRLRRVQGVAAHMSGGLDSSSIAVLAARQLRTQGVDMPTYSWQPTPENAAELASSEYAQLHGVIEQERLDHTTINIAVHDVVNQLQHDICLHHSQNFWYESLVRQAAATRGCRVILSGWGGDELISFNGRGSLNDLFWRGNWAELAKRIHSTSAHVGKNRLRHVVGVIYQHIIKASLPTFPVGILPPARLRGSSATSPYLACATPDFAAFLAQLPALPPMPRTLTLRATQLALLHYGHLHTRMQAWASQGADNHMVYRYPLLDRRIVEFALGLPSAAFTAAIGGRALFRRAVATLLPHEVCWGNAKVEPVRVQKLAQLTRSALLPTLDALATHLPAHPRLEIEALRHQFATVHALDITDSDNFPIIAGATRALQVLGAGHQLAKQPAPSTIGNEL